MSIVTEKVQHFNQSSLNIKRSHKTIIKRLNKNPRELAIDNKTQSDISQLQQQDIFWHQAHACLQCNQFIL